MTPDEKLAAFRPYPEPHVDPVIPTGFWIAALVLVVFAGGAWMFWRMW